MMMMMMTSSLFQSTIQKLSILFLSFWIFGLSYSWMAIFRRQEEQILHFPKTPLRRDLTINSGKPKGRRPELGAAPTNSGPLKGKEHYHRRKYTLKRAKIAKKRKHVESKLPLPIINVGFPKAGTSSIFSFFQQQKFRSQHWYCCKAQNDPQKGSPFLMSDCLLRYMGSSKPRNKTMLQECGNFEVFAEINGPRCDDDKGCRLEDGSVDTNFSGPRIFLPQHFNLQELHYAAPNGTFILNTRRTEDWIESVMHWSDLSLQFAHEYYAQGQIKEIPQNEEEMKDFLNDIFLNHTRHVREFVSRHPSHALVEINITASDAGQILAQSFELDASFWTVRNQRWKISWQQSCSFFNSGLWWIALLGTTAYMCSTIDLTTAML